MCMNCWWGKWTLSVHNRSWEANLPGFPLTRNTYVHYCTRSNLISTYVRIYEWCGHCMYKLSLIRISKNACVTIGHRAMWLSQAHTCVVCTHIHCRKRKEVGSPIYASLWNRTGLLPCLCFRSGLLQGESSLPWRRSEQLAKTYVGKLTNLFYKLVVDNHPLSHDMPAKKPLFHTLVWLRTFCHVADSCYGIAHTKWL